MQGILSSLVLIAFRVLVIGRVLHNGKSLGVDLVLVLMTFALIYVSLARSLLWLHLNEVCICVVTYSQSCLLWLRNLFDLWLLLIVRRLVVANELTDKEWF